MIDVTAAVTQNFPSATPRPSLDCPAWDIPATDVLSVLKYLRAEAGFDFLVDVTAVDWSAGKTPRFTVVWHLYSSAGHEYLRLASACPNDIEPVMVSATSLWPGADWHEREAYDMFGIKFDGHPDLRRILMWDGYPYFPLRKEFPLAGIPTDLPDPDIAAGMRSKVIPAPMAGGPFVSAPGELMTESEPRAKDEAWSEQREKPE